MSIFPRITLLEFAAITALAGCSWTSGHDELELALAQPKSSIESVDLRDPFRRRSWHLDESGLYIIDNTPPMQPDTSSAHLVMPLERDTRGKPCKFDLTLDQQGNAVISDKNSANLWRVNGDDLGLSIRRPKSQSETIEIEGFAGITYSPHWRSFFAIDRSGSTLWMIDEQLTQARPIKLVQAIADPCRLSRPPEIPESVGQWVRHRRFCVLSGGRPISITVNLQTRKAERVNRACEVDLRGHASGTGAARLSQIRNSRPAIVPSSRHDFISAKKAFGPLP